jgi:DEAD/DEAH box helicase domain-containing protein
MTMDTQKILRAVQAHPGYQGQIVHIETIPAREPKTRFAAAGFHPQIEGFLAQQGIQSLYLHQADAVDAVRRGDDVVVVTPTASGKTLCYNLPVLDRLLYDSEARALYIFPTKALSQDQHETLTEMVPNLSTSIYDGDTPDDGKVQMREYGRIIVTNPDMVHRGILPNHLKWHHFFSGLKYVVIDEIHMYRGVFGTHVGHIIRRLQRICRYHGSDPIFIMCSATIANPGPHAEMLTGRSVTVIDDNGAPQGVRHFILWKQPQTVSLVHEAAWLFAELIRQKARTIVFSRARQAAERMLRLSRRQLKDPKMADSVLSYRGGYLPKERRAIEGALFNGKALGVIATNALELGIDVGDLDTCIIAGFPGTIASTWQQAGRVGRRFGESLVFFIAVNNPLDLFFIRHTDALFTRPTEKALIDPSNPYILMNHVVCAAHELPVDVQDHQVWGDVFLDLLAILEEDGLVIRSDDRYYYAGEGYPAEHFSIRSASPDTFQLRDAGKDNRLIGVVDGGTAYSEVHPGAVYMHQGATYVVRTLDLDKQLAFLDETEVDYYTMVRRDKTTEILDIQKEKMFNGNQIASGLLKVTTKVTGFIKKHEIGGQVLGSGDLDLPEQILETVGTWLMVNEDMAGAIKKAGLDLMGSLHAVEHAAIGLLPLFVMCDRNDIGGLSTVRHAQTDCPTIFIHDAYHGGVGFSETAYEDIQALLEATLEAVQSCLCEDGCPGCIHSAKCSHFNQPLDKEGAIYLMHLLLGRNYEPKVDPAKKEARHKQENLKAIAGKFRREGRNGG